MHAAAPYATALDPASVQAPNADPADNFDWSRVRRAVETVLCALACLGSAGILREAECLGLGFQATLSGWIA